MGRLPVMEVLKHVCVQDDLEVVAEALLHALGRRPRSGRQSGSRSGSVPVARIWSPRARVRPTDAAEELVEDEHTADVTVQLVLGGEADAAKHLLAVAGGGAGTPTGERLGHRRRAGGPVQPGGVEHHVGGLDRHQRLSEPVPDGLELADRPAELRMRLERVLPGQLQHAPRGAHELVADARAGRGPPHPTMGRRTRRRPPSPRRRSWPPRGRGRCPVPAGRSDR